MSINETWLKPCLSNSSLHLPGYNILRLDRPITTKGGGVAFLVANHINCHIENSIMCHSIELLHISINLPASLPISVITIYRPPSQDVYIFFQTLRSLLNNISYMSIPLIILGDININVLKRDSVCKEFRALIADYSLHIVNKQATHVTSHSASQIDLLICNGKALSFVNNISTEFIGFSDHHALVFGYKKPVPKKGTPKIINQMQFTSTSACAFIYELSNVNTSLLCDMHSDVTSSLDNYMSQFNKLMVTHFKSKKNKNKYISTSLDKL